MESKRPFAGKPAVFLDRDGVINYSPGERDWVLRAEDFRMIPGVPEAVRLLNDAGFPVLLISNQRAVTLGMMSPADLDAITRRMQEELSAAGARIDRAYYCTHERDTCDCRKPLPGLFHRAVKELGVDLANSYFVGDTPTDIAAGRAAGCAVLLVLTGKTTAEKAAGVSPSPDFVAADLAEAARRILEDAGKG